MSYEELCELNYDHPDAFDTDLLIDHLAKLRAGQAVDCPVYDASRCTTARTGPSMSSPSRVLIIEGILIFQNPILRDMMDIKIFVDTDARRAAAAPDLPGRQGAGGAASTRSSASTCRRSSRCTEQFVEPSKRAADIIVLEGGRNEVALDMIIQRVQPSSGQRINKSKADQ